VCGRYTLSTPADLVAELFELDAAPELTPRYNIAPSQEAAVVRKGADGRRLDFLRWGLIPFWAKDAAIGYRTINARSETAATKPAFRAAFRRRRCLVVADGFYEWAKRGEAKQPYHFRMAGGEPMAFAGLWESWNDPDGGPLESFTILTTEANALVARAHPRMPVILPPGSYRSWLSDAVTEPEAVQPLLVPYPAGEMVGFAVDTRVNSPHNDSPECVEPVVEPLSVES
jgi:putative SOS response-associated peptidase YedK